MATPEATERRYEYMNALPPRLRSIGVVELPELALEVLHRVARIFDGLLGSVQLLLEPRERPLAIPDHRVGLAERRDELLPLRLSSLCFGLLLCAVLRSRRRAFG